MQTGFLKLLFFSSIQQLILHASIFIPQSAIHELIPVFAKETMPPYIKNYVVKYKDIEKKKFPEEALNEYKEQFQKIKTNSLSQTEKIF